MAGLLEQRNDAVPVPRGASGTGDEDECGHRPHASPRRTHSGRVIVGAWLTTSRSSTTSARSSRRSEELRSALQAGSISLDEEHDRLRRLEVELDQCWDLLRQRRAKREFGENPDEAAVRPERTVEGYLG